MKTLQRGKDYIALEGFVKRESAMAILADVEGKNVWLPKSQLEDWPDVGDEGEILIPEWLAMEKRLI